MWWNSGPNLHKSLKNEQQTQARGDTNNLDTLREMMRQKYGSVLRGWRLGIDLDESGQVDFREFCHAVREIGYVGNIRILWLQLDMDASGSITLNELEPNVALILEKFRCKCCERYGSVENAWKKAIDADHSMVVSLGEFKSSATKLGYDSPAEVTALFNTLLSGVGFGDTIGLPDITFLDGWEKTKVDGAVRVRLGTRWVNKDPYLIGRLLPEGTNLTEFRMSSLATAGKLTLDSLQQHPKTQKLENLPGSVPEEPQKVEVEPVWSQICQYDEKKRLEDFLKFLKKKFGSLPKAFDAMDHNQTGFLSMVEFQSVVCGDLRYCRLADAKHLFLSCCSLEDGSDDAAISWKELGISSQEWMTHILDKRLAKEKMDNAEALGLKGAKVRNKNAIRAHCRNMAWKPEPGKIGRAAMAFGAKLDPGWGTPSTNFDPRIMNETARTAAFLNSNSPLSARSCP